MSEQPWEPVGPGTPVGAWLETKREGEQGTNLCFCRIMSIGDDPEWIDKTGYSTMVNPGTFAPPTHWRWPPNTPNRLNFTPKLLSHPPTVAEVVAWQAYAHRLLGEFKERFKNEEVPGDIELLYEKATGLTRLRLNGAAAAN